MAVNTTILICLCVGVSGLLLVIHVWDIWLTVKKRNREIQVSKSTSLSADATKVLYGLRDFNDPHFYPVSETSLLQSLSELEEVGLIEAAEDRVMVTESGSLWGRG